MTLLGIVFFFAAFISSASVHALDEPSGQVPGLSLSAQGQLWLEERDQITVGVMQSWPPFHMEDGAGRRSGITMDVIDALNARLGGRLKGVPGEWDAILEDVKAGRLDAVMDLTPRPDREAHFNFTQPYLTIPHVIIARRDGLRFEKEEDLDGKTVAIERGFGTVKHLRDTLPRVKILEVDDTAAALDAVSIGSADAYVGNRAVAAHIIQRDLITNLAVYGRRKGGGSVLAIGTRKDAPELANIFDRALASISKSEWADILGKYIDQGTHADLLNEGGTEVKLTDTERQWVRENVVRVGVEQWPPLVFADPQGGAGGLAGDYLKVLSEKTGLRFEIVSDKWAPLLNGLRERTIDLLPATYFTEERATYGLYTTPYFQMREFIYVKEGNTNIRHIDDLAEKRVAVVADYGTIPKFRARYPKAEILETRDLMGAVSAVLNGDADALLEAQMVMENELRKNAILGLRGISQDAFKASPIHLFSRGDKPILHSILQKGLDSISDDEKSALNAQRLTTLMRTPKVKLTGTEREWLKAHPILKVGNETDWPPFDFAADGEPRGMSIDVMRAVAEQTGLNLEFVNGYTWVELMDMFKAGELQIMPAIYHSQEREKSIAFTKPYATNPSVIAVHKSRPELGNLNNLGGKRLGIVKGYVTEDVVSKGFPDIEIVPINNIGDGLLKVSSGQLDAVFGSLGVVSHYLEEKLLPNVTLFSNTGLPNDDSTLLRMGVLMENAILRDILQKGLDAIGKSEMREIRNRWIAFETIAQTQTQVALPQSTAGLWMMLAAAIAIFAIIALVVRLQLRSTKSDAMAFQMGSKKFRTVIVTGLVLLVAFVSAVSLMAYNYNRSSILQVVGGNLQTILQSTVDRLRTWVHERHMELEGVAGDPGFVELVVQLRTYPEDPMPLRFAKPREQIRKTLGSRLKNAAAKDYYMIAPGGLTIDAENNEDLARPHPVAEHHAQAFQRVLEGESVFLPSVRIADGESRMFFVSPIRDAGGKTIAALALTVDPLANFTKVVQSGNMGRTGESYAFDVETMMLSSSRFEDGLIARGLLDEGHHSAFNLTIRRSADGAPTRMAAAAIAGKSGLDLNGYEDYRGARVFGAWQWLGDLGLGLATEIDVDEALEPVTTLRNTLLVIVGLTLTLSVGATLFTLTLGEKTSQALLRSRDKAMEDRRVAEEARLAAEAAEEQIRTSAAEIERFNQLALGRESRIIELKGKLAELSQQLGIPSPFADPVAPDREDGIDGTFGEGDIDATVIAQSFRQMVEDGGLNDLFNDFATLAGVPIAIIDLDGQVLAQSRWQRACTDFHRVNQDTCARCIESDTDLALRLQDGKAFSMYKCKNGMTDCASPIVVEGIHVSNAFIGQFHTQQPDETFFRRQAKDFGFDPADYMKAVKEAPVVDEAALPSILGFLTGFARLIAKFAAEHVRSENVEHSIREQRAAAMSLAEDAQIARMELEAYKDQLELRVQERTAELEHASNQLTLAMDNMSNGLFVLDANLNYLLLNKYYQVALELPGELVKIGAPIERVIRFLAERGDYGSLDDIEKFVATRVENLRDGRFATVEVNPPTGRTLEFRNRRTPDGMTVVVFNDITELKRKEAEIEYSRERFDLALKGGNLGSWDVDLVAKETVVNDRYVEMLGYTRADAEPGGVRELWKRCIHPDDRERVHDTGQRYRNGELETYEIEYRAITKSGEERWMVSRGEAVERDADGKPLRMVGTVTDITDRKRAEQAVRDAEERNRLILESAGEGVFGLDVDGITTFVNSAACRMLGFSPEDLVGQPMHDLTHHTYPDGTPYPKHECHMRATFTEGEVRRVTDEVLWRFDGTSFPVEYTSTPIRKDGELIGAVVTFSDVTERRAAEDAIKASESRIRSIIENAVDGIIVISEDGIVETFSPAAEWIFGYRADEVVGHNISMLMPEPYAGEHDGYLQRYRDTEQATITGSNREVLGLHKDGYTFPLDLAVGVSEAGGKRIFTGIVRDITDRKAAEEELRDAKDRAEAATRSKAAFLAAMSHEIRTPMNGVVGMISLLQEGQLEPDQRTMMNTVQDSAFALLQIINDILDFSKIEAGKLSLEHIPVNIDTVMEGVTETLLPIIAKKNLRMALFIDPAIPGHVLSDQVRLRQILFNLAGNSAKFTENTPERQGVVGLRAELAEPVAEGRAVVRFSITDNGIGMKPEVVKKLFTPFTQADQSTTRKFGGTGLGLSICKNLSDLMGGEISVESVEGEGSSFHIVLPFKIAEHAQDHIREFDLSGLEIAYAVNHEDTAEAVERYATSGGANVVRLAYDAVIDEVKAHAAQSRPDILILGAMADKGLRDTIIEVLRSDETLSGLRFVLLSNNRSERRGMVLPDMVVVACAPVRKTDFMHGVAMAAGRASPEIDNEAPKLSAGARKAPSVEDARAAGDLILIAEDNLTNQDVITRQLNVLGYACEVADDGAIALGMLKTGDYGMLLTDCHMPNMDGYELTAAVRDLEMKGESRLPIVAITANALQGEADRCFACGMDDYLSKPLEMNKLKAMLAKWLPVDHGAAADVEDTDFQPVTRDAEASAEQDPAVGGKAVNIKALTDVFGDDMGVVREILGDYVQPSQNIIDEIGAAFGTHDAKAVGMAAHKLKSSSRAIGADTLADLCFELETAGKGGDWDRVEALYPGLSPAFADVIIFIEKL
ncbi:MAG: transporter substrate-binding domain-containing protein [Alphaproteobacteria bacterium]|nr:transporter substrate-binding domain-containing protein [Alphaproteobacteria bacterium]